MHTSGVSFVLIILSAISSVNYGFPHISTISPNTVADVTEVSTNQDASVTPMRTSFTSATPTEERHTVKAETTPLPNPSASNRGDDNTSTAGHMDGDIEGDIEETLANDVNDAGEVRRPVADLSSGAIHPNDAQYNDSASNSQDGFPWWSLMLMLLATIVIIIAIALPFVLYNRRLNQRRTVINNSKRASEIIVDSWMAASQSSIPQASSSSTSSENGNDDDVETKGNTTPPSNWGMLTADDGNSRDIILGAEGGCGDVV